ncbi:MAG TPA: type II secretion system F family protein [Bryobacteraceae bacterium]|nr:type II secretion system F family protein [Bryobacteraceae bacterium]
MLALSAILVFVTTFVAVALAVLIAFFTLQRLRAEASAGDVEDMLAEDGPALLRSDSLSTIAIWSKVLERFDFIEILRRQLNQAGQTWSVGRFTMLMLLTGTITLAALSSLEKLPIWASVMIALGVSFLPYLYILKRREMRFNRFEEHFPDALDSLARAMRSGHPFPSAMEIVSAESEEPVASELRQTAIEGNFGTSWEVALSNLCTRMPLLEVSLFASAVQLQSRTGGKLNEVLGKIAENMRESVALKGEVRALAAHGRMTGIVLSVLPLFIAGMMMIVSPGYLAILINAPMGKYLIAAAVVCLILAHFIIQRLVDIRI